MDTSENAARPDALLDADGPAGDAFEAFNAMETTKARHFALLERLDAKRERYGLEPTATERARLASLLADHDAQVRRFTRAGAALKAADRDAHLALFAWIGAITAAGPEEEEAAGARGPTH